MLCAKNGNSSRALKIGRHFNSAPCVVSFTARAGVLSQCDGDVRVLPDEHGELNFVFKPNVFNAESSFYLRFTNPKYCSDCFLDVHCNSVTDDYRCIVDSSKGMYYVSLKRYQDIGRPTKCTILRYVEGCQSTVKTLHTHGKHFIIASI